MITLGIESTAHTFGVGIVRDGKVIANSKKMYTTESGGIIPIESAKHHLNNKNEIFFEAITEAGIKEEDIDVIAFQEIGDTVSFKQMVNNLPGYQYYFKSLWYGGLAYIYKTNLIHINAFYEIYTTSPYWSPFPRSPLVMDMNYLGNRFFVINNHLYINQVPHCISIAEQVRIYF